MLSLSMPFLLHLPCLKKLEVALSSSYFEAIFFKSFFSFGNNKLKSLSVVVPIKDASTGMIYATETNFENA